MYYYQISTSFMKNMIFLYGEAVTPAIVMHVGGYYWVECRASLVTSLTSDCDGADRTARKCPD